MTSFEQHLVWRQARAGKVTASIFRDILRGGHKAHLTLARKILDEAGVLASGEVPPNPGAPALEWGHDNEPRARAHYTLTTGRRVELSPFVLLEADQRIGCSPDGLVGEEGLIEIKCPYSSKQHARYMIMGPESAIPQVQGQLWITGRRWCDFVSFDPRDRPGCEIYIHRVERDEAYIADLARFVTAFADLLDEVRAGLHPRAEETAPQQS